MNHQPSTINHSRFRSGFTLIELMMVIVVMAILVGLLLPVLIPSREDAKRKKRANDRRALALAIKSYQHEYMRWPNPDSGGAEGEFAENNVEVVNILLGEGVPGQPIRFINPGTFSRSDSGSLRCPDGDYYRVGFTNNRAYVDGRSVDRY